MSCAGDHVYRLFYLAVGKLADIPFRDVNFLRYFGCSNICFLEFLISLANFRLTWRIVAPTWRKIARKLGDISKRIERDILSHYFCKLPHTNTSTTSFFGWTRNTSCAFLRLAVTLVTSCGFLRLDFQQGLEGGVLIPHSHSFTPRIPHPAVFHRYPEFRFFFPKNTLKKTNFCKS